MASTSRQAKAAARRAEASPAVEVLARSGLVARGVVYALIGVLALEIAAGRHREADRTGALTAISREPAGNLLLVALAVAFAGYALWRLLQALIGHRDADPGLKRVAKRAASFARAVLYASFAFSTVHVITSGPSHDQTRSTTARALAEPGGRLVVGAVAVGFVIGGLVMATRGITSSFLDELDLAASGPRLRAGVVLIGRVGLVGRGLVITLLGAFGCVAAATHDPAKAKGLDAGLRSLTSHPYGKVLLVAAAVSLVAFGLWSFAEARYRRVS